MAWIETIEVGTADIRCPDCQGEINIPIQYVMVRDDEGQRGYAQSDESVLWAHYAGHVLGENK